MHDDVLWPHFLKKCLTTNEPLRSAISALIVISKKRPLWTCHLGSFLFAPLSVASFLGRLFFFLNTYRNYLKAAVNFNDQLQHQDLHLLCLPITFECFPFLPFAY